MLKRILFTAAFCLSLVSVSAMTIDETIEKLSKAKNAEVKNISCSLSPQLRSSNIDSVTVVNLEECDDSVKKEFADIFSGYSDPAYETLVKTSEGDEKTLILTQSNGEGRYKAMVVLAIDGDEYTIVKIMGNISPAGIPSILKK